LLNLSAWLPLAQTEAPAGGSPWQMLLMTGAMFLGVYALLFYPQRKQQREHDAMLRQIQRGDHVVTTGGIHGKVTGIADDVLTVEIAERVRIKVSRSAIGTRVPASAGEREKLERDKGDRAEQREKEKKA
jgi:preprotein translocase subunit YajC